MMREGSEKVFQDSVHGCITMPAQCMAIIDTPEFQRLRFIRQLGCSSFVYPSACHSRFEHSIGVAHLAGKLVEALRHRQPGLEITAEDAMCVQVAGLCHDLGHGPFSHLWEQFAKDFRHEEMSGRVLDYLLKKNNITCLQPHNVTFIKALIAGENCEGTERGPLKQFLFDIINNQRNGIDVDKWDYLLRDSHHLGIPVSFSYERLIHCSRVLLVEGNTQVCFRDKVANDIYDMFSVRYMLHMKAYQHRVCRKLDAMFLDAFRAADDDLLGDEDGHDGRGRRGRLSEAADSVQEFVQLTDDVVQRMMRLRDVRGAPHASRLILTDVFRRRLYQDVGHVMLDCAQRCTVEDFRKLMLEAVEVHPGLPPGRPPHEVSSCIRFIPLTPHFGRGHQNPMAEIGFFSKKNPDERIKPSEPIKLHPNRFELTTVLVVSTSDDPGVLGVLRAAFEQVCCLPGFNELSSSTEGLQDSGY